MPSTGTDHMFPFEFVRRSEAARNALRSWRVRLWDQGEWAFWRPDGGHTKKISEAQVFDFALAWELAIKYAHPEELLFDPVNATMETDESFKSRWADLVKQAKDAPNT